ncbi:unnamed protein product [Adineta ricciae]|uniref:Uncharacterized protein n=1 Tax=Adineta ricciae TaxID=249248 RepID=A0A814PCU8_ADIRI|nr:unnamed protein product [Adineta ricciae]CAF1423567.1 unnamed protein product [Adineta ricciae]
MVYLTILFTFATLWTTTQSQTWAGIYQMNTTCITSTCCCLVNDIVLTRPSLNILAFNATLSGQCFGLPSITSSIGYPVGYSLSLSISIVTLTVLLSNDSNTLTAVNPLISQCTGRAVRKTALVAGSTTASVGTATSSDALHHRVDMIILLCFVLLHCMRKCW